MEGLIVLLASAAVLVFVFFPKATSDARSAFDDLILYYAKKEGLPFSILKAVVRRESNFNPKAWNDERKKGDASDDAIGLMQIRQGALTDYNNAHGTSSDMDDLIYPAINLKVGSWYLGRLIKKHGINAGVEMYNVGESGYLSGKRSTKYLAAVLGFSRNYT